WNTAYIPLRAERDYRETTPVRNPLRDLPGTPDGTCRVDLFYTQAMFRRQSILQSANKLVGGNSSGIPHRSPPRCLGKSERDSDRARRYRLISVAVAAPVRLRGVTFVRVA